MSVTVEIPAPLRPLAEGRRQVTLDPAPTTVGEALASLWARHPALRDRIVDEQGRVRPHVNVFVGADSIRDGAGLACRLSDGAEIAIIAAVSGGAPTAARA